jgi:hypothetical protein
VGILQLGFGSCHGDFHHISKLSSCGSFRSTRSLELGVLS